MSSFAVRTIGFALVLEANGLIFCLPGLHSKGPALYVQSAMCSVSFAGPTHVAEQAKLQPYVKDP